MNKENYCCDNEMVEDHEPERCRIKYHLDRYANAEYPTECITNIKKGDTIEERFELLNLPASQTISKVKILSQSNFLLTIKNENIQVIEDWVETFKPKYWHQQPEIYVKFRFLENRSMVQKGYLSNLFVVRCFLRILDEPLPKDDLTTFDMPKPNLSEIGHIFPSDDDESQDDENDKIFSNLEPMNSEPEPSPNSSTTLENSTEVEETSKLKNPKRLLLKLKRNSLAKGRVEWQKAVEKKNMEDQDDTGDISLMEEEPSLETSNYEQQKAVKFWFGQDCFPAEAVKQKRIRSGRLEYLVKWKGYSSKENTWEPEDNIFDKRLIQEFKEKQGKSSFTTGRKRSSCKRRKTS